VKRRGVFPSILIIIAMLGMGAGSLCAQSASGAAAAHAQADAFLSQARPLVSAGAGDRAGPFLASAIDLAPDYSEALYLRARAELADRSATRQAVEDLRRSIANRSWSITDPSAAEQDLADLSIRTGNLVEARRLIDSLVATHPEDSRNLLLEARLLSASGDTAAESRVLSEAAARFPLVDEFRLLSSSLLQRQGRRAAAREAISAGLTLHPGSLPLLLAAARLEPVARARTAAVDLYVQSEGTDPLAAVLGLESSAANRARYLDLFFRLGGLSRQDLVDRVVAAVRGNAEQTAALQSQLAAFSGTRDLDANGDGFWEERWLFEGGVVTRWSREPAQDGVTRYAADFAAGRPVAFSFSAPEGVGVTLKYSRYPFIDTAQETPGGTLSITPYTLQCVFLNSSAPATAGLAPRLAQSIRPPSLDRLRKAAFAIDEYSPDGTRVVRHLELAHGVAVFMEEDTNGDGILDRRVWYRNGIPVRGSRSLTGNGVYQVGETWRDGRLAGQAIDTDGDGKIDFRETFGERPVRAWDYNEDGRDDSRERSAEGGVSIQEFSTALNGVFDLSLVWRGARIVEVTRDGSRLAVTRDAVRGVTWIGQPAPSGVRPDLTQPDGMRLLGGRRYLLFRRQGITYAEAVK
jgi:tetratricopeptide (TPR) repeat protein